MKSVFIFIFAILSFSTYGQRHILLEKLDSRPGNYSDNDSTRIYSFDGFDSLKIVTYIRTMEYFTVEDLLHRDYIQAGSKHFILDKLFASDFDKYTMSYDLIRLYTINIENAIYVILEGTDIFPMGTDQQVCYVVLVSGKNGWSFHSGYENEHNMPTDGIKVKASKNKIILTGKYLH